MSGVFVKISFFWLLIFMVLQPMLSHIDYTLSIVVKSNAEYAAQKMAPAGMLTAEVKEAVMENLAQVGFKAADVQWQTNTTQPLKRGEHLEVTIIAPRMPMFVLSFFGQELPKDYYARAYTTSEWVDG